MDDLLKTKWERGKNNTLHFYRRKLPWKAKSFNTELLYLPDYFDKMIGDKKEVTIAELGAGMFCSIGSLWKTAKVKMYPSDALSDEFNQMLKDNNITPLVHVEKQDMENLTYKDNFFDIVHCCNALDHCSNPLKAIKEMYRVLKHGGYIYIRHVVNVGEHEHYSGLHMWNLNMDDYKDCIIWNRDERHSLESLVPGFKSVIEKDSGIDQIVSILHKK
jgi:ubiquinone/menaquinone biosynthesis C-methylase UbiE